MRNGILAALTALLVATGMVEAQPIAPPPEFQKLVGPKTFEPDTLRAAIVFPSNDVRFGFQFSLTESMQESQSASGSTGKPFGDDRDAEMLMAQGAAFKEKKNADAARTAFERAEACYRQRMAREPRCGKHLVDLAQVLRSLDREEDARAATRKCLELDPKNADAWKAVAWQQWTDFLKFVNRPGVESWTVKLGEPLPQITRELTEADRDKARQMLKEALASHLNWKRLAPESLVNIGYGGLLDASAEILEARLKQKDIRQEDSALGRMFLSRRMSDALLKYGREHTDPEALVGAFMLRRMAIEQRASDSEEKQPPLSQEERRHLAAIQEAAQIQTTHRDPAIARRAWLGLVYMHTLALDFPAARKHAGDALKAMPREMEIIQLVFFVQSSDNFGDDECFWLEHLRLHPGAGGWARLGVEYFRLKRYGDADQCFKNSAKLNDEEPTMLMGRVALLMRNKDGLAEAGRHLKVLEAQSAKRRAEPPIRFIPELAESCRYLRAVHTALSGNWEQGRQELLGLRDKEVLLEATDAALKAFPQQFRIAPPNARIGPPMADRP